MAIRYQNDCCQCAVPGYPCTGEHKRVPHYYCDGENCGKEFEPYELCDFYGDMLCFDCLVKQFRKVSDLEE